MKSFIASLAASLTVAASLTIVAPGALAQTAGPALTQRLACKTHVHELRPGVPAELAVEFDERAQTARLSARELGAIVKVEKVSINSSSIALQFTTPTGTTGRVSMLRGDGKLFLFTDGPRGIFLSANCRSTARSI